MEEDVAAKSGEISKQKRGQRMQQKCVATKANLLKVESFDPTTTTLSMIAFQLSR